jgi:C4-dicarboxylate-specific signal transduction histidine kinase
LLVYCSVRDVTERKRLAAETRRLQIELVHADRVTRTGALTASLAHELNQPLAAILSNAQAALRFLAQEKPDLGEIREILTDIVRDDKRASAVISGLRTMLRRQEPVRVGLDVAGTIREVLVLLNSELLTHQVEVTADFEAGCSVLADKAQLQQVVLNLVMNAIQAMQGQAAEERRLALSVSRTGEGEVRVAVRDAGVGIPEEKLATVFNPFWTTKDQGMGLGLAVCRAILEAHGGAIWVEPNQDRGVTFFFRLPAVPTEAPEPEAPVPGGDRD